MDHPKRRAIMVLFVTALHLCNIDSITNAQDAGNFITDNILNRLKNSTLADDFDTFQKVLQDINLKKLFEDKAVQEILKQANMDSNVVTGVVEAMDILKIIDAKKLWKELNATRIFGSQAVFQSMVKNINMMTFISSVDWSKLFQKTFQNNGVQLPRGIPNITQQCSLDLLKYFQPLFSANLSNPETLTYLMGLPAVKMIDAMGKIPSGILTGNTKWFGAYHECDTMKDHARYCFVSLKVITEESSFGTCMPKKCTNEDVAKIHVFMGKALIPQPIQSLIQFRQHAVCEDVEIKYHAGFISTIVLCSIIMALLAIGTLIDLVSGNCGTSHTVEERIPLNDRRNNKDKGRDSTNEDNSDAEKPKMSLVARLLVSFSIIRNIKSVLSTDIPKGAIECINGIRAMSMFWIILGHIYFFGIFFPNDNLALVGIKVATRYTSQALMQAFVAVDTFFLLSGLLVGYLTLKRMDKSNGKINLVMYYLHRFIRLTPPYMFVILIWNNVFPYMIRGPSAQGTRTYGDGGKCNKYWWTNLLYISNFYPTTMDDQCLGWSWYLSVDMQFYVASPFILYLMVRLENKYKDSKYRHVGPFIVTLIGCLLSVMIRMILIGVNDYPALIAKGLYSPLTSKRQDAIYIKPYTRIPTYLVGLFLGYLLSRNVKSISKKGKGLKFLGWLIAVLLGYAAVYGPYASAYEPIEDVFNKTERVLFGGFYPFVWAVAVAWVIYACHNGFGGLVNSILSWRAWIPMSRLTFGAYLLHPPVIYFFYLVNEKPHHFQENLMPFDIVSITVFSYAAAFVLSVGVEYPVLNLEKLAFKGR